MPMICKIDVVASLPTRFFFRNVSLLDNKRKHILSKEKKHLKHILSKEKKYLTSC